MKQEFSSVYYFIITTKGASVNLKGQGHEILDPFLVIKKTLPGPHMKAKLVSHNQNVSFSRRYSQTNFVSA